MRKLALFHGNSADWGSNYPDNQIHNFFYHLSFIIILLGEQQLIYSNISSHYLNKYILHSITQVIKLYCLTECGCICNIPIDKTAQNKLLNMQIE